MLEKVKALWLDIRRLHWGLHDNTVGIEARDRGVGKPRQSEECMRQRRTWDAQFGYPVGADEQDPLRLALPRFERLWKGAPSWDGRTKQLETLKGH
jgi:hypothetical protein